MSIKCSRCENKVFDSNAYLKMCIMENDQREKIDVIKNKLSIAKSTYGDTSDEVIVLLKELKYEVLILDTIGKCKNTL
ncbi:hypothetical protein UT300012_31540 [Paraclostridium bifermentans]